MRTNAKTVLFLAGISLLFSGCGVVSQPKPKAQSKHETGLYTKEESALFKRIKRLSNQRTDFPKDQKDYKKIKEEMLKGNPVYAEKHKAEAIVASKKSDAIVQKPVYLEPLFAKVEIMPYQTSDGLYHEQQSVWLKVKQGEIVIKTNDYGNTTDTFTPITILDK